MTDYMASIAAFYLTHSPDETVEAFHVTHETLSRYMRKIREEARSMNSTESGAPISAPKILIVDIETAPILAYTWGLWKQNINIPQIVEDWFIICWSAKWLFDDNVFAECVTPKESIALDDSRIMKKLWKLLDEADMVIAHNAKKFDIPRINSRMLVAGMMPPSPYIVIDTLYYYRKQFGFSSNKLDYLNTVLSVENKTDTGGLQTWIDCKNGSQDALDHMLEYNINDVKILEANYLILRPWIKNHPNVAVYMEGNKPRCSVCGSSDLSIATSNYVTPVNAYTTYRCNSCGAIAGRERKSLIDKDDKKNLLRAIAR